jgi:two-component system sensor histidine kinase EvgS
VLNFSFLGVIIRTCLFFVRLLAFVSGILLPVAHAAPLHLNAQQLNWIKVHPQVSYTVNERWPQEYAEDNKHIGLSRTLLDDIERRTGLKFVYVSPEEALLQPPMMISALNGNLLNEEERSRWLWTFPWANIMPMIVGKNDSIRLRTIDQLTGQRVAIAEGSDYEAWMRRNYPGIDLVVKKDVLSALQSVDRGESNAAIASGLVMLPILQRHYFNRLAVSAQIPEMVSGIRMAVNPAYPELQSILNEAMENISAADAQKIYTRWIDLMDMGMPTWGVVLYHYRYQLLIAGVLLLLLLLSLRRATLARRQAQRSEQQKTDFLNMMSHEIRTPMNAIIAALELIRQPEKSEKREEYVELAFSSSQDLLELLNSVLDHSKINQQLLQLERAPCELATLLEAICDGQHAAARRKGLKLTLHYDPRLSQRWVSLDAHRIRQILNNLLSNAIKFTPQGEVSLQAHGVELQGKLDVLIFTVRDTGIGIAAETQGSLFQAWEQGTDNRTLRAGGSGLGLYICRALTTLMQGTITLKSETGKGTVVEVTIPVEECEALQTSQSEDIPLPQFGQRISVLLVEDHPANRQLLGEQLALMGCHYDMAEDGETALRQLEEENYYDIILLDCGLPGMDGYQTALKVREFEQCNQHDATPIVAISALNSESHLTRCRTSGMDHVLTKPIRIKQLAEMLQRCVGPAPEEVHTPQFFQKAELRELSIGLKEDAVRFQQAMTRGDLREMIYHVHRITGVAQMYDLSELATFSSQLEETLRSQPAPAEWRSQQWLQKLSNLITSLQH